MNLRRKATPLCLMLLLTMIGGSLIAGSGGPDPYGYIWKDSNEPGFSMNWVDITGRPGAVQVAGLADDNAVGPFNIGWNFHYYWSDYNSIKLGSNGWMAFSNVGNIASCFPLIPTPAGIGDNIVAPFMSDLTFISNDVQNPNPGELWYWTNNVDSFVIQWVNVPWWRNNTPDWIGSNTFELILSGNDSAITFQYLDTDSANFPGGNSCATFMEIGIENVTGNLGLNFSSGTTVPPSNYVVKWIYPSGASFLVPDATPRWNMDPDNAGQFVYLWTPTVLQTNIGNVGNTPITTTITAAGRLRDLQLATIWEDTTATVGLADGSNVTLSFGAPLQLTLNGQYYYDVGIDTDGGQDINPTNNANSVEVVGVARNGGDVTLSFASGLPPSESVSWAGGNTSDGVAVKMVPPGFPALIDTVMVYITGDGDLQTPPPVGFTIRIHALDGNGQPDPNTVLNTTIVPAGDVQEDGWNAVPIQPALSVASGGFAVAWMQLGSGIALGAEQFGPISRRTYEILGGSWAPYRSRETTEFLVKVHTSLPVGIESPDEPFASVRVFPNPAQDRVTVAYQLRADQLRSRDPLEMQVIDANGRVVMSRDLPKAAGEQSEILELHGLPSAVYLLRIHGAGQSLSKILAISGGI